MVEQLAVNQLAAGSNPAPGATFYFIWMTKFFTYLLENKEGVIYIGSTSNLELRLKNHNDSSQKGWTKKRGPWKMIYFEEFSSRSEAVSREIFLKSLKAGKRIKDILKIS